MTGKDIENALRFRGGQAWYDYAAAKEEYIAGLIQGSALSGEPLPRKRAQALWYENVANERAKWLRRKSDANR